MEVSGAALLAFLKSFWRGHRRSEILSGPSAEISALPGWSGPEQGIVWGWKWHGDGWYGHSSSTAGAYGLVRVQPVQRIAIFVCSRQQNCTPPATALFGRWFKSFAPVRGPRLLPVGAEIDFDAHVGIYDIAATRVVVGRAQDGLSMQAYRRERGAVAKEPFHAARLRPASEHVFYPEPMHAELFPYLQFIGPASRRYSYIWNGKGLWLRR